ncbi:outer membrane lipoprotein-sorting protein [Thioalkalivibrio sp. ALE31]|uniref:outer membrane lipoprotein-sorting protein n=1 Tax=Thioalkalivibrio sp. ALE31 TaxID=1158182 RepID=UPI0003633FBD|nr:outer membrane lipoprotein-sorting protein [Thioalkalivibrio sp. ALE31]
MMNRTAMFLGAGLLLAVATLPAAALAEESAARELARAVHERPDGDDAVTRGIMTLTGGGRRERVRESYEYRLDGEEPGASRNLIRFTSPRNIADTAILVHNHPGGDVDQWLYLPAIQRERRISSENRGGSFVQSELYFEDLEDREPHKDHHRILGEDAYEGTPVTVLESVPVDSGNSVYSKRVSWIHEETLLPLRIDLYEGGEEPAKRLEVQRIEEIQGYWTVTRSSMTDLASGRTTILEVEDVTYNSGLPDELFTLRGLSDPSLARPYRP